MSVTESSCVLIEDENNNAFSVRVHILATKNGILDLCQITP